MRAPTNSSGCVETEPNRQNCIFNETVPEKQKPKEKNIKSKKKKIEENESKGTAVRGQFWIVARVHRRWLRRDCWAGCLVRHQCDFIKLRSFMHNKAIFLILSHLYLGYQLIWPHSFTSVALLLARTHCDRCLFTGDGDRWCCLPQRLPIRAFTLSN